MADVNLKGDDRLSGWFESYEADGLDKRVGSLRNMVLARQQ
jgi:hypothetical protein